MTTIITEDDVMLSEEEGKLRRLNGATGAADGMVAEAQSTLAASPVIKGAAMAHALQHEAEPETIYVRPAHACGLASLRLAFALAMTGGKGVAA